MILTWNKRQIEPNTESEIGNQYIWHNYNIKTPSGDTINYTIISKLGINYIKDIIENNTIISIPEINRKNITMLEKFEFKSMIKCIPNTWKQIKFNDNMILSREDQEKQ